MANLRDAAAKVGLTPSWSMNAEAFSVLNPNTLECTIHFVKPETRYNPESIGHELAHCLYGNFHDSRSV